MDRPTVGACHCCHWHLRPVLLLMKWFQSHNLNACDLWTKAAAMSSKCKLNTMMSNSFLALVLTLKERIHVMNQVCSWCDIKLFMNIFLINFEAAYLVFILKVAAECINYKTIFILTFIKTNNCSRNLNAAVLEHYQNKKDPEIDIRPCSFIFFLMH